MIRYVDSAGWTWEVCELEPQASQVPAMSGAARFGHALGATVSDIEIGRRSGVRAPLGDVTGTDTQGELYFFSRLGSRKLRRYPSEWFQLAREELEALCARAEEIA